MINICGSRTVKTCPAGYATRCIVLFYLCVVNVNKCVNDYIIIDLKSIIIDLKSSILFTNVYE